jgi:hypothetical protein
MLLIFIALKNPLSLARFEPTNFGPSTITTRHPRMIMLIEWGLLLKYTLMKTVKI